MLADGLIEETKRLIQQYGLVEPLRRNAYGVVHQYLNGDITGRDELIDRMVIADGHLVKKQLTWCAVRVGQGMLCGAAWMT